jgi:hypothetical protein
LNPLTQLTGVTETQLPSLKLAPLRHPGDMGEVQALLIIGKPLLQAG